MNTSKRTYLEQYIMLSTVSPRLTAMIKGKTTSEMRKAIKDDAATKSQLHKVDTRRRLIVMQCDEEGDILSHLDDGASGRNCWCGRVDYGGRLRDDAPVVVAGQLTMYTLEG
jgi:hypothetical protein